MTYTPFSSSPGVRSKMQQQRTRDTAPEMALRCALHARGLRYRVQVPLLPRRTVDIVFPRARVAVDVRGCYWHSCPLHATAPKANGAWWAAKLARNVERDEDTAARLSAAGWQVCVVWECEVGDEAADRIQAIIEDRRKQTPVPTTR